MPKVIDAIIEERVRQVNKEGFTSENDDVNDECEMAAAAAYYAHPDHVKAQKLWPKQWDRGWAKKYKHARRRQLVIAAALIVAEIERLDRVDAKIEL